jgi:L-Ala-D/L-Glu epimerase / N-acetyl-D-glutamate racemase
MELTFETFPLELRKPFVTHKSTTSGNINQVVVRLRWRDHIGLGVAVSRRDLHTTDEGTRAALTEYVKLVVGSSPFQLSRTMRLLESATPAQSAALAAVDMALHDLLGKASGLALYQLLGLEGLPIPETGLSFPIATVDETLKQVRACADWPILKLKMSTPNDELVQRVRDIFSGRLWIDANGAWEAEQAVQAAERFSRYGVELIEQPVPPESLDALRFVHERSPVPIIADEANTGALSLPRLSSCAYGVVVKLFRCGGIRRALEMIALARSLGLKIMLGCVTESALGVTAISQLGGLADFMDVDGHLDLANDPFVGITIDRGNVILPATPGLGVTYRPVHR